MVVDGWDKPNSWAGTDGRPRHRVHARLVIDWHAELWPLAASGGQSRLCLQWGVQRWRVIQVDEK